MNKKTFISFILALSLLPFIAGCSQVKQQLGIGRNSPDEFAVVKRAPLSLPPEYNLLPPDPNKPHAEVISDRRPEQAKEAVFGLDEAHNKQNLPPETALLEKAGAYYANPDIRNILDREAGYITFYNEEKNLTERILFWKKDKEEPVLVDAKAEAERLKKNEEEGLPPHEGEVPTIHKKNGLF
ncbi:MAG: DUF3035 domain-containing protein [Alphaproteobacteria bacterium]|nr:MAG: DUF3035 domain-containing protein [Alphaproteobacteria bacterium]